MKRVTSWYVRIVSTVLVAALLFIAIGCSFGAYDDIFCPDYIDQIVNPDRTLFYGETITIAVGSPWVISPHATNYMLANPGVRVNVVSYDGGLEVLSESDWRQVRTEMATRLMAGSAPTLIDSFMVDSFDPRQAAFFYDWRQLMDADPNFNKEDWFMNAFHAFSVDGRFYHFPINIFYSPVVANRSIPGLLEAMKEYADGITFSEIMQLYQTFSEHYPHHLELGFSSAWVMHFGGEQFIDVVTGRIEFSEEFVNQITYADSITSPDFREWQDTTRRFWYRIFSRDVDRGRSERYFFNIDSSRSFWYFLDFNDNIHMFAGMTPFVNNQGELLVGSADNFHLNANATIIEKAIAWDFLMFAMQPENLPKNHPGLMDMYLLPPNRYLTSHIISELMSFSQGGNRHGDYLYPWFPGTLDDAIEGVTARMTAFGEMPMRATRTYPRIIDDIIDENMRLFHDGLLSAEQTALNIQNQITLVLMEMER